MKPDPLAALTPAQREALAARQADPRARALILGARGPARPLPASRRATSLVVPSARVEADGAVVLRLDGLRLNGPNGWRGMAAHMKAKREQGDAVDAALRRVSPPDGARWAVTFTREGVRLLDDDNLAAAFKRVRDHVAAWLGTGDAPDAPVAWRYEQRRAKGYAVEVRVEVAK